MSTWPTSSMDDPMDDFAAFAAVSMPGLLRYGHALTGNPHDAADLVQTVLERVGSRWSRVVEAGDPLPYVRRAMANAHVSRWRRARREIVVDRIPEAAFDVPEPLVASPMWRALADLPPRQRAVVVLRFYEDMSEADVAETLGISLGTVKSQCSRAMDRLRISIAATEGDRR